MPLKRFLLLILSLTLLTSACGSSGGGGGEGGDNDSTKPVITLKGENPSTHSIGVFYIDAGATALDNIDGDITDNVETISNVDSYNAGTYIVTLKVSDAAGNIEEVTRTVIVEDDIQEREATINIPALAGDDGKLFYRGKVYGDSVSVRKNDIVIMATKNGEFYLYNPLLGDIQLSKENSRLAMFYYYFFNENDGLIPAKMGGVVANNNVLKTVYLGGAHVDLSTQIKVELPRKQRLTIENQLNRFAAITQPGWMVSDARILAPNDKRFDANWFRNFFDALGLSVLYPDAFESHKLVIEMDEGRLMTFGASFEGMGNLALNCEEAKQQDHQLMKKLDKLQKIFFDLESTKLLASTIPLEFSDLLTGLYYDWQRITAVEEWGDKSVKDKYIMEMLSNAGYASATTLTEAVLLISKQTKMALGLELANSIFDAMAFVSFYDHDVSRSNELVKDKWKNVTCFDEVEIGEELQCSAGIGSGVINEISSIENNCNDGVDNDCDLSIDCDDSDCNGDPACALTCYSEDGRHDLCRENFCYIPEITAYGEILQEYVPCFWD